MSACKLKEHIDWRMQPIHIVTLVLAVIGIPLAWTLPVECGYENGLVENTQMAVLLLGIVFALTAKDHREVCIFAVFVLVLLLSREMNTGRTVFFPKDEPNSFYRWKELPSHYKIIAYSVNGAIMAAAGIYFLYARVWKKGWELVKNYQFPIWSFILMVLGMGAGMAAEKNAHLGGSEEGVLRLVTVEEAAELVFYLGLVSFIYLYGRSKTRPAGCCSETPKE